MRIRYLFLSAILAALPALESHACRFTEALTQEDRDRADLVVFGTPVRYDGEIIELSVEEAFEGSADSETIRIRMNGGIAWGPPQNLTDLTRDFGGRLGVGVSRSKSDQLPEMVVLPCSVGYLFSSAKALEWFGYGTPESVERDRIAGWELTLQKVGFESLEEAENFMASLRQIAVRRDIEAFADKVAFPVMVHGCLFFDCQAPDKRIYAKHHEPRRPHKFAGTDKQWDLLQVIGLQDLRHFDPGDYPKVCGHSGESYLIVYCVLFVNGQPMLELK